MTPLGFILLVVGGIAAALTFLGLAPDALRDLPIPFAGWVGLAIAGALLMYFNRRPGN